MNTCLTQIGVVATVEKAAPFGANGWLEYKLLNNVLWNSWGVLLNQTLPNLSESPTGMLEQLQDCNVSEALKGPSGHVLLCVKHIYIYMCISAMSLQNLWWLLNSLYQGQFGYPQLLGSPSTTSSIHLLLLPFEESHGLVSTSSLGNLQANQQGQFASAQA